MNKLYARFFKSERDGAAMARLDGKVSFPERGWAPKVGETYEVEIVGQSKSGKAQFLRRIAGPFYSVEGGQRQYGWYNTTALGEPDVEFQSGFSMGSAYYTAVWTRYSYEEALRLYRAVRDADTEKKAAEARRLAEAKAEEAEQRLFAPMRELLPGQQKEIEAFLERSAKESGHECLASLEFVEGVGRGGHKFGWVVVRSAYVDEPGRNWSRIIFYFTEGDNHLRLHNED